MKHTKKLLALLLAVVMILAMAAPALAEDDPYYPGEITIIDAVVEKEYDLYRIFDMTGTDSDADELLDRVAYTIAPEWRGFFATGAIGEKYLVKKSTITDPANTTIIDPTTGSAVTDSAKYSSLNELTDGSVTYYMVILEANVAQFAEDALAYVGENGRNAEAYQEYLTAKATYDTAYAAWVAAGSVPADEPTAPTPVDAATQLSYTAAKAADEDALTTDGDLVQNNLPLGYYLVYPKGSSVVDTENGYASVCSLTSTVPTAEINIKSVEPTIEKTVNNPIVDSTDYSKTSSASIGDTVNYKIDGEVPDMTGYDSFFYVVKDTMSKGLTFNDADVVVAIDKNNDGDFADAGEILTRDAIVDSVTTKKDYYVEFSVDASTGVTSIEIGLRNFIQYKNLQAYPIRVTYTATLNQDASVTINENKAQLVYSTDPKVEPTGRDGDKDKPGSEDADVIGKSPESKTTVLTAQLKLNKTDGTSALTGAKFKLEGITADGITASSKTILINSGMFVKVTDSADTTNTYFTTATTDTTVDQNASKIPVKYYALKNGKYTSVAPTTEDTFVEDVEGLWVKAEPDYEGADLQDGYRGFVSGTDDAKTRYKLVTATLEQYIYTNTESEPTPVYDFYKKIVVVTKTTQTSETPMIEGWVDENGLLTFTGLGEGVYKITELVAPEGFNLLDAPFYVKVVLEDTDGVLGTGDEELVVYKCNASGAYVKADGTAWATTDGESAKVKLTKTAKNVYDDEVINKSGIVLPSTGGIGTKLFILCGALAMLAAGIFLVTNQRMRKEGI